MDQQNEENISIQDIAFDVVMYSGDISIEGYELLSEKLEKIQDKSNKCLLIIETPGGDPHAGFRIARALHHNYESFDVLVPRYCKSAGTLICTGASTIYMDDVSELGPLDIQVKKDDEIFSRSSGLDIIQALNNLQTRSISTLKEVLIELTGGASLSTKVASEIACKLTTGIYEPIYAQIDPIKIAEMLRATTIAYGYGNRLNEKSGILFPDSLSKLVLEYPSHGFVIDRKEARAIFARVGNAKTDCCIKLRNLFNHFRMGGKLVVEIFTEELIKPIITGNNHEPSNPETDAGSDGRLQPEIIATGEGDSDSDEEAAP